MMGILTQWRDSLLDPPVFRFPKVVTASGERIAHLGGRSDFARAQLRFEPADEFAVSLDGAPSDSDAQEFAKGLIFGVLDVLKTFAKNPILNVKVIIERMEIHAIESNARAFRLAGRVATQKALKEAGMRRWDFVPR